MWTHKYEINIRSFAFKLHLHHYNEKYFIMHNMLPLLLLCVPLAVWAAAVTVAVPPHNSIRAFFEYYLMYVYVYVILNTKANTAHCRYTLNFHSDVGKGNPRSLFLSAYLV